MKTMMRKTTAWLMVVCMVLGFAPVFGSAAAASTEPEITLEWISTKTDLIADTTYTFDELFSYTVAYSVETGPQDAALAALEDEIAVKGLAAEDLATLLRESLQAIGMNLKTISVDDILNLPANIMDDLVTYLFAGLKLLGINVDSLYEKITSLFFLRWYTETYIEPQEDTGNLTDLEARIESRDLKSYDLLELLFAALESVGKNLRDADISEFLDLSSDTMDQMAVYILAGLRALGVDIDFDVDSDAIYDAISSVTLVRWFINTYYLPNYVQLACDLPDVVTIDNENRIVTIGAIESESQTVKFTLSANPDLNWAPISYEAVISGTSPKTLSDWARVFVQALLSFDLKKAFEAAKGFIACAFSGGFKA